MRTVVWIGVFLVLVSCAYSWETFQYDYSSSGYSPGVGYLGSTVLDNFTNWSVGMDYQPMVADISADGAKEIVIFSDDYLYLFDKQLNYIASLEVGSLEGQFDIENMDDDPYIEIIAIVDDHLTVWQYDGEFSVEFSLDVSSQGGYQQLRCLDFDDDSKKECLYRDYYGIIHSYEINSSDELNIDIKEGDNDKNNIVPSVVDFDNDGDKDALFWFNNNFTVVDSNGNVVMSKDLGEIFNYFWYLDKSPLISLKFVDIDEDSDYEIIAVWRHDRVVFASYSTLINIRAYDTDGSILFTKQYDFQNDNCRLNGNHPCIGYASDVLAKDNQIIVFLTDSYYSDFGDHVKVLNASGTEIDSHAFFRGEGTDLSKSTFADMDGDGSPELILRKAIYGLDGSVVYNFSSFGFSVPVDIDGNSGLDLILSKDGETRLFLDDVEYYYELAVSSIGFSKINNSESINTSVLISNLGTLPVSDALVKVIHGSDEYNFSLSISSETNETIYLTLNLAENDEIVAIVDPLNTINETEDYFNNKLSKEFFSFPFVFVDVGTGLGKIDDVVHTYIVSNLAQSYSVVNHYGADVIVLVGRNNPLIQRCSPNLLYNNGWGTKGGAVVHSNQKETLPYTGLVGSFDAKTGFYFNKKCVLILGNALEGDIAGVKEFLKEEGAYLNTNKVTLVDREDAGAIGVFDWMHNLANQPNYMKNNNNFAETVSKALSGIYDSTNLTIRTTSGDIALRLIHRKPLYSDNYISYRNNITLPIVFAGGLWSDIYTWDTLGKEMASTGRDVWQIELTGGPGTECDDCLNYKYDNLTDTFWPAYIGAVQYLTSQNQVQYVGHSNGARTGLDALTKWQNTTKQNIGYIANESEPHFDYTSDPVETFVAVGAPGAFAELSSNAIIVEQSGLNAINTLVEKNKNHVTIGDVGSHLDAPFWLRALTKIAGGGNKISINLFSKYRDWISYTNDTQPGENLVLSYFVIIQGNSTVDNTGVISDVIVPIADEEAIYFNINEGQGNRYYYNLDHRHLGMAEDEIIQVIIKQNLNKQINLNDKYLLNYDIND